MSEFLKKKKKKNWVLKGRRYKIYMGTIQFVPSIYEDKLVWELRTEI